MAEPKKPAGATQQAGPEEPTRYIEQQPMGAEGEEGEGGKAFDYAPIAVEGEGEEYVPAFDYAPPEEVVEGEGEGGKSFDYMGPA